MFSFNFTLALLVLLLDYLFLTLSYPHIIAQARLSLLLTNLSLMECLLWSNHYIVLSVKYYCVVGLCCSLDYKFNTISTWCRSYVLGLHCR